MAIGLERSTCQHEYSRITQIMSTDDLSRVWVSIWPEAQSSGPRFAPCVCGENGSASTLLWACRRAAVCVFLNVCLRGKVVVGEQSPLTIESIAIYIGDGMYQ